MTPILALLLAGAAQHQGHGAPVDPHAGHAPPAEAPAPDPHAAHGTPPPAPVGPPPAAALAGPDHAADTIFDPAGMAAVRAAMRAEHGGLRTLRIGVDRLETAVRGGRDGFSWDDAHLWYGTPTDRLWLKSRGEGAYGEGVEAAEVQALWSRALDPWFDLQAGVRADLRRGSDRVWLALGVQGLAPYRFELDGAFFLSTEGELTARFEAEYDQRLTQRLILQPSLELAFSAQDIAELRLGSGLTALEAGLRLRYEVVPEFAPYVGVRYERAFGDTARFARSAGEDAGGWSLVLGIRSWF